MADPTSTPPPERLHALDAVRGFALIAGIVFHATMSFLPGPNGLPIWIVTDDHPSATLALVFHVLHIFRMSTFFLIAGFFAHMMVERRGTGGFIRDRAKRIALPLVVGWPIVFAAIVAVTIWGAIVQAQGHPLPPAPKYPGFPAFPLTHLWFLYVLLWLYAATLGLRALANAADRSGAIGRAVDAALEWLTRNPLGVALLAAPAALALATDPTWLPWAGVPTPDGSLIPNLPAATTFFSAFGFGWLLHRQPDLLSALRRHWPLNLALGLIFTTIEIIAAGGFLPTVQFLPLGPTKLVAAAGYALALWTLTFAAIGLALRFLSGHSAARRYIADASYWLYLIHLPIVMALQAAVSRLAWPWEAKFVAILGVALPVMLASYELLVRHSFIGGVLNGRRYPWPARRATISAPASESARQA